MRGRAGVVAAIAVGVVAAGSSMVASAGARVTPRAVAARSCSVGSGEGYGYTYLTSLSVSDTTCAVGKSVVRHHGRGWSCHRRVLARSPVQYDARMSCSSGRRHVTYTYTQNT